MTEATEKKREVREEQIENREDRILGMKFVLMGSCGGKRQA
jgi:hypothetical protein